ncbi:MAG: anhydro-N-acetylmuramic acid kinase [Methylovirgula sp.]
MSMLRAIGLMSGTSMDGVDIAVIETDGEARVMPGATRSFFYAPEDRALLQQAVAAATTLTDRLARPGVLAEAEAMVTERHVAAVEAFLAAEGLARSSIDVVGFHGQTVLHRPGEGLTVQIGDGAALAPALRLPLVHDFRAADVAAGGQGAPLVPIYHKALALAAGLTEPVVVLNVGGVANLTFLAGDNDPLAFDTGPGNALIDDLMFRRQGVPMDEGGFAASQGRIDFAALVDLLAHPYFDRAPPKSLDRNEFSAARVEAVRLEDAAATLTAFTAQSIVNGLTHLPQVPKLAILCGGGAHNLALRWELMQRLPCGLVLADTLGWSADAMEAQAFAYLAVRRLKNLPITFPTTTGVKEPLQGGCLATPE